MNPCGPGNGTEDGIGTDGAGLRKLMLVVSPESSLAQTLAMVFRDTLQVVHATSGRRGLELALQKPPHIVIAGMRLEGMHGIDFLVRFRPLFPTVPVIIVTTYETPATMREALRLGAHACIIQPFSLDEIRSAVFGARRKEVPDTASAGATAASEALPGRAYVPPVPEMLHSSYRPAVEFGRSDFGRVFHSRENDSGRHVAIKQVFIRDRDKQQQIIDEVQKVAQLKHPNVVSFFDHFIHDDMLHLVTELCDCSLRHHFRLKMYPGTTALYLARKYTEIMASIHAEGIVHHNLKPENILTIDRTTKYRDFGLVVSAERGDGVFATAISTRCSECSWNKVRPWVIYLP